ncbi:lipase family protein [Imperialibacter roseus]|uniref:Lipase family protein n=1 Tax=Imperialibacter roseus TaxID=1324217 RepID=A0ABZ0ITM7_9BACT|nr:alpha/beta fold hydrolase [Imperialibacter roseus]WOK08383.1 lipase family protein [Imperialibacter roseus]
MKKNYLLSFLFILLLGITSCQKDDDGGPSVKYNNLTEANLFLDRPAGELKGFIAFSGIDIPSEAIKYNTELYKVTYVTEYKGQEITASGLIVIPTTVEPVGMISFQHGTIASHSEAPSASSVQNSSLILYAALASTGFITVVPDFIGFGSSKDILHPYYVKEATSTPIIDNLKAAHQLAQEHNLNFNEHLFLAGYSQGGYATMATQQAIENDPLDGFELLASFPSSGGYDVKGMQEYFFGLETYDNPFFLAYVALAYQTYYGWTEPLSNFFVEAYAEKIPNLFDGSKSGGQINEELSYTISELVQPDLLENIDTNPDYQYLVDGFNDNGLTDWTPTTKTYMFHGTADVTVPYQNSVDSYNKLIENGTPTSVLTLTPLEGFTHYTGVVPYVEAFVPLLLEYQ